MEIFLVKVGLKARVTIDCTEEIKVSCYCYQETKWPSVFPTYIVALFALATKSKIVWSFSRIWLGGVDGFCCKSRCVRMHSTLVPSNRAPRSTCSRSSARAASRPKNKGKIPIPSNSMADRDPLQKIRCRRGIARYFATIKARCAQ